MSGPRARRDHRQSGADGYLGSENVWGYSDIHVACGGLQVCGVAGVGLVHTEVLADEYVVADASQHVLSRSNGSLFAQFRSRNS